MTKADVLILGGGLAGLSTAYHLNALGRVSSLVVEKNPSVGGTAGTVAQDGFLFDYTGHLLHLHDERAKRLILDLLGRNVASHRRRSFIYSHGVHTPYPFQANTFGLPERVVEDCVAGFLRTVHRPGPSLPANPSFESWCLRQFGPGISRHFMLPYNRKLWRLPLSKLTTEWQGRFVPRPSAAEVLCGALGAQKKAFGYNSSFRYPRRGGIQALSDAFLARLRPGQVQVGCAVQKIDLRQRVAVVEGLGEVSFKRLVNTIPLPDFVDLAWPLSSEVRAARGRLRWNTVYNLNLGVARDVSDKHWVYFPEARYPFYRVGFSHNFS
ncbi:MAG: FAD-dependent oxidoreductase, partial [Elusimicrobia bacterium]|nr:FAD-dependent oxidoreductase [Elusimicrobiota bacterium]